MNFVKSLLLAVGTTGASFTAVAIAGLLSNDGLMRDDGNSGQPAEPQPVAMRTVVLKPVALDPRGYDLKGAEQGDQVFVSVEMIVRRKRDRQLACTLLPRLKTVVLRDLGPKLWRERRVIAEGPAVNAFLGARFDEALGGGVVKNVKVRFVGDRRRAPKPNCVEALHGGWQKWIRMNPLRRRK